MAFVQIADVSFIKQGSEERVVGGGKKKEKTKEAKPPKFLSSHRFNNSWAEM